MMIEFIKNNQYGCYVFQNGKSTHYEISSMSYIKELCIKSFFTYEGYLKAVQKTYGKAYKIPIYIDDTLMLIPSQRTRNYENIWINYVAVNKIIDQGKSIEIHFDSKTKLRLDISSNTFQRQILYLRTIRNEKVKHFHI